MTRPIPPHFAAPDRNEDILVAESAPILLTPHLLARFLAFAETAEDLVLVCRDARDERPAVSWVVGLAQRFIDAVRAERAAIPPELVGLVAEGPGVRTNPLPPSFGDGLPLPVGSGLVAMLGPTVTAEDPERFDSGAPVDSRTGRRS